MQFYRSSLYQLFWMLAVSAGFACGACPVLDPRVRMLDVGLSGHGTPMFVGIIGPKDAPKKVWVEGPETVEVAARLLLKPEPGTVYYLAPCPNPDGMDVASDQYMMNLPETRNTAVLRAGLVAGPRAIQLVVPAEQWDVPTMFDLLQRFEWNGAKVWKRKSDAAFVVQGGQRIVDMVERFRIPELMGVKVEKFDGEIDAGAAGELRPEGWRTGAGEAVLLDPRQNNSYLGLAFLFDRMELVWWTLDGQVIIESGFTNSPVRALNFAHEIGISTRLAEPETVKPHWQVYRPRVGLYRPPDEWTAWVLDFHKVPYKAGEDLSGLDVVITGESNEALKAFAQNGGTVIVLPATKGEIVRRKVDTLNPIGFGMPPEFMAIAGVSGGDVFRDEKTGKGRMIFFGIRPEYKGQTFGTFKLLLNAIFTGAAREIR